MSWATFKDNAHQVAVAVGLALIFELGQVVTWKLAKGHPFPQNYDTYIWALIVLAGANVAGIGVLRATSPALATAKGEAAAKIAAATAPQPTQVLAASGSAVTVSTEAQSTAERPVVVGAPIPGKGGERGD